MRAPECPHCADKSYLKETGGMGSGSLTAKYVVTHYGVKTDSESAENAGIKTKTSPQIKKVVAKFEAP